MIKINYYNPLQMNALSYGESAGRLGKRRERSKEFTGVGEDILR